MKRTIALLLTFPLVISLGACSKSTTDDETAGTTAAASTEEVKTNSDAVEDLGEEVYGAKAVYSDNYCYTQAEMTYQYLSIYSNNYNYLYYYGVDISKSLKDQMYSDDMSWFDVLMDEAVSYATQYLYFCEAANDAGVTLSEENKTYIDESIASVAASAAENGYESTDAYLSYLYGPAMTESVVRSYLEKYYLGYQMYMEFYNSFDYSDKEVEEYYEDNKLSYQYVDYAAYNFVADDEIGLTAEMCKNYAEQAAKAKDTNALEDVISEYVEKKATLEAENAESETSEADSTEETEDLETVIEEAVESALARMYSEQVSYSEDNEVSAWLFADDTKVKETYTDADEENGTYRVYMLTKKPYCDTRVLKNVRHILFTADTYGSEEEAEAKAEEILQQWKDGDATEDSFAELADEYSEDSPAGGLYENVYEGQMVEEFENWLFDDSRKVGDVDIVQTSFGYHIMYFAGDGDEQWKYDVKSDMISKAMQEKYDAVAEKHSITTDEDVLKTVQEVF
ncbi:MAG: peptidylprolyl isomerase [Lachnospiraceae bacterium]